MAYPSRVFRWMSCWISKDFWTIGHVFKQNGWLCLSVTAYGKHVWGKPCPVSNLQETTKKSHLSERQVACCPKAPCREYLPTFPLECAHFSPDVGKYSIHGAFGVKHSEQKSFFNHHLVSRQNPLWHHTLHQSRPLVRSANPPGHHHCRSINTCGGGRAGALRWFIDDCDPLRIP